MIFVPMYVKDSAIIAFRATGVMAELTAARDWLTVYCAGGDCGKGAGRWAQIARLRVT
jgi:hypothetical protein